MTHMRPYISITRDTVLLTDMWLNRKSCERDAAAAHKAHRASDLAHQRMLLKLGALAEPKIAASSHPSGVQPAANGATCKWAACILTIAERCAREL